MNRKMLVYFVVFGLVMLGIGYALSASQYAKELAIWKTKAITAESELQNMKAIQQMPMMVEFNQTGGDTFNMTSAVASDGSVANTTTQTLAWDMYNSGNKTETVQITLVDPVSGAKGLPDWLQNSYVQVYLTINGKQIYLFGYPIDGKPSGKFTNGTLVSLPPYSALSGSISLTFVGGAPAGTFPKGKTDTITLYIYDPVTHKEITTKYTVQT